MKAHHVELASVPWDGRWYAYARCRCGWKGEQRAGRGAYQAAELEAQRHMREVRQGGTGPARDAGES